MQGAYLGSAYLASAYALLGREQEAAVRISDSTRVWLRTGEAISFVTRLLSIGPPGFRYFRQLGGGRPLGQPVNLPHPFA